MSNTPTIEQMPRQKISDNEKGKDWAEKCVKAGQSLIFLNNQYTRNSRYNKQINYDLYAGRMHPSDIESIMNPTGLKDVTFPAKFRNHPVTNPYIKALIGEEIGRRFDYSLKVENEDAISEIEKNKKEAFMERMREILLDGLKEPAINPNDPLAQQKQQQYEQELSKRLEQLNKYINYEWQDLREIAGERLLNHYEAKNDLKSLFTKGFEDALVGSEEIYHIDIISNEPVVRKCNSLNTYFLMPPDSYKVEDSELIVEEKYLPLGGVLDDYYEELKPDQIEFLETRTLYKGNSNYGGIPNYELMDPTFSIPLGGVTGINISNLNNTGYNSFTPFDTNNNVRVCKVKWRSMREIAILTYIDESGNQQKRPVHPEYTVNKANGESIKKEWIGEWWEGTQLANEYFVKCQPCSIQYRSLNNLSQCSSGYVGTLYKTNSSVPQSLLDIMKPYQYAYNLYSYRTELAFIKAKGKIGKLDLARIPDNWEPDKWLYYAEVMGWAVEDSFKEAKKGAATGKLAGNMSASSDVINLELGNYIQQHIQMMQYIETQLDKITGITPERRGQMTSSDQGLGVTEQSRQASSTITEWYFKMHDDTKVRVYRALLEAAKYCLRNGNKTIQYISDEVTTEIFKIDGELINECEYGIIVRDSIADAKALDMLRRATEAALQSGQVDIIQLMDIYSNKSFSSIRRKIESSVAKNKEEAANEARGEQQHEAEIAQRRLEMELKFHEDDMDIERAKLELDRYKIDTDAEVKLRVGEMSSLAIDEGASPEAITKASELALKEREISAKSLEKRMEIIHKHAVESRKLSIEEQKLAQEKKIKEEEFKIARENMKNDLSIAKTNKANRATKK